MNAREQGRI